MSKKIFTLLLLAVFMLAQFSFASAATVNGDVTVSPLPTFHTTANIDLKIKVINMDPGTNYIVAWSRLAKTPANLWSGCLDVNNVATATYTGTYAYANTFSDQDAVEFYVAVSDVACATAVAPATASPAMVSTYIDDYYPNILMANPPSLQAVAFNKLNVACNTFEMWAIANDKYNFNLDDTVSGLDSWNELTTGAFAVPAPIGPTEDFLSWVQTIPSSANGNWEFTINPTDVAGNAWGVDEFRLALAIAGPEKADCADFTDVAGHANEVYIRYLADLELIGGNPDGSFAPDNTLTRAEAAALFEKANGYEAATLPTAAPSDACTFPDVADTDWFAGWVWQACADGFMNGLTDGNFGPADLLTRGQIVTIFNNIHENASGATGSYLDDAGVDTVLNYYWNSYYTTPQLREAAWQDVSIGDYFAGPVQYAYAVGVADGTDATHFSPNQYATRGEFAKMLYRAISRAW